MANLDQSYITSLVEYARGGDSDAFAELYMATCQRQYRFACGYLKDEEVAKEALRDTYLIALKNIAALGDAHLFLSWLSQINFRVCLGMQKKQNGDSKELTIHDDGSLKEFDPESLNPEESAVQIDGQDFIIRQIMNLPFTESQVIILRYYNKLKIRDIARLMDLKSSSVRRHLANGCKKLKQLSKK